MPSRIERNAKRFTAGCVLTLGTILAIPAPSTAETGDSTGIFHGGRVLRETGDSTGIFHGGRVLRETGDSTGIFHGGRVLRETGDSTGIFHGGRVPRHRDLISSAGERVRGLTDGGQSGFTPIPEPRVDQDTTAQIEAIDLLMTRVDALDVDESDPAFGSEGVFYALEVAAGPKCIEGTPGAGARAKAEVGVEGANLCTDVKTWKAKEKKISKAKKAGKKPKNIPKLTKKEEATKAKIQKVVDKATEDGQKQCEAKQTCTKGSCKGLCKVSFDVFTSPKIKCKSKSVLNDKGKLVPGGNVTVKILGTCGCTCDCSM